MSGLVTKKFAGKPAAIAFLRRFGSPNRPCVELDDAGPVVE
jgi:hypothetical protein